MVGTRGLSRTSTPDLSANAVFASERETTTRRREEEEEAEEEEDEEEGYSKRKK